MKNNTQIENLAIIIPVFNEKHNIAKIINSINKLGTIIIVDDNSTDGSKQICNKLGVKVLSHDKNRGYDSSLRTGLKYANKKKFEFAITFDGDGQHDPSYIPTVHSYLLKGNAVVVGNRDNYSRIAELIFGIYARILWGIKDPLSGLKGYNMALCKDFIFNGYRGSVGTDILIQACRNNLPVATFDIKVKKRDDLSRFGVGLTPNLKILYALLCTFLPKILLLKNE